MDTDATTLATIATSAPRCPAARGADRRAPDGAYRPSSGRRWVAIVLLATMPAVLWMAAPAYAASAEPAGHGGAVLTVATPPTQGITHPAGAPLLPIAQDEAPAPPEAPLVARTGTPGDDTACPRPHRPAAGRAPPG